MKNLKFLALPLSVLLLTGCLEPKLPKCDSKEAKSLLIEAANRSLNSLGSSEKVVSLKNVKQITFNEELNIRVCKTDFISSNANTGWFSYKVYWSGKQSKYERMTSKAEFFVEITGGGDY